MLELELHSLEDLGVLAQKIVNSTDLKVFAFFWGNGRGKNYTNKKNS